MFNQLILNVKAARDIKIKFYEHYKGVPKHIIASLATRILDKFLKLTKFIF